MSTLAATLRNALTVATIAVVANGCIAQAGQGAEGAAGSTSEAQTCLTCGGGSSGGSSGGSGGSGGGVTYAYSTSCTLLQGTNSTAGMQLPFNTQVAPSGSTASTGWASYSLSQYETAKTNVDAVCAGTTPLSGVACFFLLIGLEGTYEPWVFENQLADALHAADASTADVTQSLPLLLASNDPTALEKEWFGAKISAAQANNAGVRAVLATYQAYANTGADFVSPELFQCTVTKTNEATDVVVSSTTSYYIAWDPNCGSTNCAGTLTPRVQGTSIQ